MKKILGLKSYLVLLVMLAALLSPAQAALIVNKVTDEFSLESPYPADNVKACQCSTRTDVLEIKNVGDFKALFKVEILSPIKDMITLSDDTFTLSPDDDEKVYVQIKVPCDQPLDAFYVARVSTDYGRSKEIYKDIVSRQCQNIKYASKVMNDKILPGEVIKIKIELQNVADFTDTFTIALESYSEFTTVSDKEISLAPDEEKTVEIDVTFPLAYYGNFAYPYTISSTNGKNSARVVENFKIEQDYDYTIKTEEAEIEACEDVIKEVPINFNNLASVPNKYYLYLTGPAFAKISPTSLFLGSGKSDSINLIINPAQKDVGEYDLILSAGTEYGDMNKDKSFKLRVNDCFKSEATVEGQGALVTEKACCGQKTYTLNIRNDGMYEETYQITVDSPGWVSVKEEDQFVKVKPSQNMNVPVTVNLPCVDAKQISFIIVKQLKAPYQTHEIRVDMESLSQRTCYNVDLLQDKYRINYDTKSMSMLLQQTGLKAGTYKLTLGELDSRFVYLGNDTITFEPGETKVLHIYPRDQNSYKQGTYLNKLTLKLSLIGADEKLDISYDRQFWVVLRDKNFITKAIDYVLNFNYSRIGWCGLVTLILAGLAVIMMVMVAYMRLKKDFKMKRVKASCMKKIKILNIVLIFLLIISILALIMLGSPDTGKLYEEAKKDTIVSPLYHEWKQNTPYQIDLSKYFTDPDTDVLSYTSSQPDHFDIKIQGTMAILTPEHNWAGEEKVVFTANDKKGGLTDSPIMILKVLRRQPVGPMAYWNTYCVHINIVLFIILLLLVLLCLDVVEEKGYNYYNPRKNSR